MDRFNKFNTARRKNCERIRRHYLECSTDRGTDKKYERA